MDFVVLLKVSVEDENVIENFDQELCPDHIIHFDEIKDNDKEFYLKNEIQHTNSSFSNLEILDVFKQPDTNSAEPFKLNETELTDFYGSFKSLISSSELNEEKKEKLNVILDKITVMSGISIKYKEEN